MSITATNSGPAALAAASSAAPATSAPVLEFLCLFTHDLRRKQKRWQDGRLKYHTFNKRVMAYDDRGNFVGDMHWRADWDFDAGEELQLERGGIIVQVSDCVGQQDQDLSELVDKRVQEREQRLREKEQRGMSTPISRPSLPAGRLGGDPGLRHGQPSTHTPQIRHQPLTALIGTPTGHHGRAAVPLDSPFEQRRKVDVTPTNQEASRPAKRRRFDDDPPSKLGYAQSLFGTTLTLSGAPPSSTRLPSQPTPSHTGQRPATLRVRPLPDPESEEPVVPTAAPPAVCDDATVRSPLHQIDEQSFNSVVRVRDQGLPKKQGSPKDTPAAARHREILGRAGNPNARPVTKSPEKEVMDLTLSNEEETQGATIVDRTHQSPLPQPREPDTSTLPPTKRTARKPPVSRAKKSVPLRDVEGRRSIIEVDEQPVDPRVGASERTTRRTELRLSSRRKRGLLVVSEQGTGQPAEKTAQKGLPIDTAQHIAADHHDEITGRDLEGSILDGDRPTATPVALPGDSPAQGSWAPAENEVDDMPNPKQRGDEVPMIQIDEEQGQRGKTHSPLGKTNRKRSRRGAASHGGADGVEEEAIRDREPRDKSRVQKRAKRKPGAARRSPAAVEDDDDGHGGHGQSESEPLPAAAAAAPAKPHLVKLARKSVRSKELIGFVYNETDAGSGNGTFSVISPDRPRIQATDSNDVPALSEGAADENDRPPSCNEEDSEPVALFQSSPEQSAHKDNPTLVDTSNPVQSASRASPPLVQEPLPEETPAETDRVQPAAHEAAKDQDVNLTQPAQARLQEAAPPCPDNLTSAGSRPTGKQVLSETSAIGTRDSAPMAPPRAQKLANPATRGRKAALKSHAAGQVPQPVLPADVGLQVQQFAQREQSRVATRDTDTTPSGAPKIKMTFPGFVSAKGAGPWSREAHDLLATGRPV